MTFSDFYLKTTEIQHKDCVNKDSFLEIQCPPMLVSPKSKFFSIPPSFLSPSIFQNISVPSSFLLSPSYFKCLRRVSKREFLKHPWYPPTTFKNTRLICDCDLHHVFYWKRTEKIVFRPNSRKALFLLFFHKKGCFYHYFS